MDLSALLDLLPFGVVVWQAETDDPADLRLVYSNAKTEDESGFDARQIVGGRMEDVLPAALDHWGPVFMRVIRTGEPAIEEAPFGDERHPHRVHRVHIVPFGDRSVLVVNENVTEVKEAYARLEQTNAELDRFASSIAHDLKGPLAGISGFADLIGSMRDDLPREVVEFVDWIGSNARRTTRMIDDILDYARHGGPSGERTALHLNDLVDGAIDALAGPIDQTGAHIEREDLGVVWGNASVLHQVFLNLLMNALQYARQGVPPRIKIWSQSEAGYVLVAVSDNGIGIEPEDRERVFELGARVDDRLDGTGIGLATCRVVIEHHGGQIKVEDSPDGVGVTLCMKLPIAEPATLSEPAAGGRTVRVLVVDDDVSVRRLVHQVAHRSGVTIVGEAANGAEAVDLYRTTVPRPDVVVMDARMPVLDGLEAARQIRRIQPDQPVVLYSAHIDAALRRDALAIGLTAVARKGDPIELMQLIRTLAEGDSQAG